jgi:hypothetical protein
VPIQSLGHVLPLEQQQALVQTLNQQQQQVNQGPCLVQAVPFQQLPPHLLQQLQFSDTNKQLSPELRQTQQMLQQPTPNSPSRCDSWQEGGLDNAYQQLMHPQELMNDLHMDSLLPQDLLQDKPHPEMSLQQEQLRHAQLQYNFQQYMQQQAGKYLKEHHQHLPRRQNPDEVQPQRQKNPVQPDPLQQQQNARGRVGGGQQRPKGQLEAPGVWGRAGTSPSGGGAPDGNRYRGPQPSYGVLSKDTILPVPNPSDEGKFESRQGFEEGFEYNHALCYPDVSGGRHSGPQTDNFGLQPHPGYPAYYGDGSGGGRRGAGGQRKLRQEDRRRSGDDRAPVAAGALCGSPGARTESPNGDDTAGAGSTPDTMKSQLQALQQEDCATIFIVRHINKLGFSSADKLRAHFGRYGEVKAVFVSHSRVKSLSVCRGREQCRLRAAALGFVVMTTPDATAWILQGGPEYMVNGVTVHVHPFHRRADPPPEVGDLPPAAEEETQLMGGGPEAGAGCRREDQSLQPAMFPQALPTIPGCGGGELDFSQELCFYSGPSGHCSPVSYGGLMPGPTFGDFLFNGRVSESDLQKALPEQYED